jgi:hypothetical protein
MTVGGSRRVCEWCGDPLAADAPHNKVTCGDSHRARRHRWLHGVPRADGTIEAPPAGSPLLYGRETRANGAKRHSNPSGLQVPYRKALQVLTAELGGFVESRRVEAALRKALPAKQRERLEAMQ